MKRQIFVLKIILEALAHALKNAPNLPPFRFVWLSLSEL